MVLLAHLNFFAIWGEGEMCDSHFLSIAIPEARSCRGQIGEKHHITMILYNLLMNLEFSYILAQSMRTKRLVSILKYSRI